MSTIIGLSGYATSGKDTVGQILVEDHGFTRVAFADKLKALALKMNPLLVVEGPDGFHTFERLAMIVELYEGIDNAKLEVTAVREYLQKLGENVRNELGHDVWVEAALRGDLPERVVVTDCRYVNEASLIAVTGYNVRVERPGVGPANGHVSEHALDNFDFDYTCHNDGTIDDLRVEVARVLGYLGVA